MKTLVFKKTKAQLERERRNKKNLKKSITELKTVVARIRRWRSQVQKELQNERKLQETSR
ncbi:MAG TPA: hypothetical protein VJJ48_00420 [Candidatus Paceibacterota bacterium]